MLYFKVVLFCRKRFSPSAWTDLYTFIIKQKRSTQCQDFTHEYIIIILMVYSQDHNIMVVKNVVFVFQVYFKYKYIPCVKRFVLPPVPKP